MNYHQAWLDRVRQQFPDDFEAFLQSMDEDPVVSIRLHPFKGRITLAGTERIPWCPNAYYLSNRPFFTADPNFHAGGYYVQEASSMLLDPIFRYLGMDQGEKYVLDCCAAPGGKTTHLLSLMNDESVLLANELIRKRHHILVENTIKWGYPNLMLSNSRMEELASLGPLFDLVLVDAPCSGEGLFRKDKAAIREWTPAHAKSCSLRQQKILEHAISLLRPGGHMIYSTCTYNPEENERNVEWMSARYDMKPVVLPFLLSFGCLAMGSGDCPSYQCLPHQIKGEGFFIACLQKKGAMASFGPVHRDKGLLSAVGQKTPLANFIEPKWHDHLRTDKKGRIFFVNESMIDLDARLTQKGIPFHIHPLGEMKREKFVPSHFLAMSDLTLSDLTAISVDVHQAVRYLKKETFQIPLPSAGWHLVTYDDISLGWMKSIEKKRWNNYYPTNYRIRAKL